MTVKLEAQTGWVNPYVIHCGRCHSELAQILDQRGWDYRSDAPSHVNIELFEKVKFPAGPKRDLSICIQPGYAWNKNEDGVTVYSLIRRARESLRSELRPAGYRRGNRGRDQAWLVVARLPAQVECRCDRLNWLRANLFDRLPVPAT